MPALDTRFLLCTNPRVNGQSYTAISVAKLKVIKESDHLSARFAEAELLRRGHTDLPIYISVHAIDAASNKYWKVWVHKRKSQQGFAAWLKEVAFAAYKEGVPVHGNVLVREHNGMTFCFQANSKKLKLVTVS